MIVRKSKEIIEAELRQRAQFLANRYDDALPIQPVTISRLDTPNDLGLHWTAIPATEDEGSFVRAAALEVAAIGWDLEE
jgi:hypothetical protein